jgi:hypothetical protein
MRGADPLPRFAGGNVLRRLSVSDLPGFQAYRHDPVLARYQDWSAASDAEAEAFLARMSTAEEAINLVFERTNAERALGIADARNVRSIRLLQRVGMRLAESRDTVFREERCIEHIYALPRP